MHSSHGHARCLADSTQGFVEIVRDEPVREPHDPDALPRKPAITLIVMLHGPFIGVDSSVDFHRQPGGEAEEVEDIRTDRVLPAKLQASEPLAS